MGGGGGGVGAWVRGGRVGGQRSEACVKIQKKIGGGGSGRGGVGLGGQGGCEWRSKAFVNIQK